MKSPMMLVCALLATMSLSVWAADEGGAKAPAEAGKGKHAQMTPEQREAMVTKRLEGIKAKDEAQYKELVALKEKDPKAFNQKMRELGKAEHEAMMNKLLEGVKAKDEAQYKELVALKEKDPEAFKVKMHELAKEQGKAQGEAKGKGKRKHKPE